MAKKGAENKHSRNKAGNKTVGPSGVTQKQPNVSKTEKREVQVTWFSCSRKGAINKNATHGAAAHQITSPPLSLGRTALEGDEGKVFLSCDPGLPHGTGEWRGALGTANWCTCKSSIAACGCARACRPGGAGSLPHSPSQANCRWH